MSTRATQPITFVHRNLVFGESRHDAWAVYRLGTHPYVGLTRAAKLDLLARLATLARGASGEFSLLRVARPWSIDRYLMGVEASADVRHVHRTALANHLKSQSARLAARASHTAEVYLSVRLRRERGLSHFRTRATAISGRRLERLLEDLVGPAFVFAVNDDREAFEAIELLGLDALDDQLRRALPCLRPGRCLIRDQTGRAGLIHLDPLDPALLTALAG